MAAMNWTEFESDLALLGLEAEDDGELAEAEDDGELAEDDDGEFDPITLGAASLAARGIGGINRLVSGRRSPRRAKPTGSYGRTVKGRNAGVVQTPNGAARIALPGNFPTVDEFRKTVAEIQKDMKANSTGIKELADQQKKDVVRLAGLISDGEKKIRKQLKRTQLFAMLGVAAPLAFNLVRDTLKT